MKNSPNKNRYCKRIILSSDKTFLCVIKHVLKINLRVYKHNLITKNFKKKSRDHDRYLSNISIFFPQPFLITNNIYLLLKIPKKVDFLKKFISVIFLDMSVFFFRKLKKRIIALLWCTIPWNIYFCYVATKKLETCNKMYATILLPIDYSRKKIKYCFPTSPSRL